MGRTVAFKSTEISPGVNVDYDRKDRVTGIEILDFSKRFDVKSEVQALLRQQLAARKISRSERVGFVKPKVLISVPRR